MGIDGAITHAETLLPGAAAPDGESDPRWQAIIEIGSYIESHPDAVWGFAARWGTFDDPDLRSAIATCLVEHLLEYHFDRYFPLVSKLAKSNRYFANTFLECWKFGQSVHSGNSERFDALKYECEPGV